jgi:hypothetical protein
MSAQVGTPTDGPSVIYQQLSTSSALRVLQLHSTRRSWMHRRVETVGFEDDASIRRWVSVDFTLPATAPVIEGLSPSPTCFLPLALLRKSKVNLFDLYDEAGVSLPLLSSEQHASLVARALSAIGGQPLNEELHPKLLSDLRIVAGGQSALSSAARQRFMYPDLDDPALPQRKALMQDREFQHLLEVFAGNKLLVTAVGFEPGRRRVLKFGYDEVLDLGRGDPHRSAWMRLKESLGVSPTSIRLPNQPVAASESFHVQIALPEEIRPSEATLAVSVDGTVIDKDSLSRGERQIHLAVSNAPIGSLGETAISIQVVRKGWLAASLYAATVVALVLLVAASQVRPLLESRSVPGQGTVALLLALVGLLVGLANRQGEHALTGYLLSGLRVVVATSGLLTYVVATTAVFRWPAEEVVVWIWRVAASAALGAVLLIAWVYVRIGE